MSTTTTVIVSVAATIYVIGIICAVLIHALLPIVGKWFATAIAGDAMNEKEIDENVQELKDGIAWKWRDIIEVLLWPITLPFGIWECITHKCCCKC